MNIKHTDPSQEKTKRNVPCSDVDLVKVGLSFHLGHHITILLDNVFARVQRIENVAIYTASKHCSRA